MNQWLFVLLALVIVSAAVLAVTLRNLIHSVLSLIVVFLGTAAVYVGLEAPFIAAVQVLIYVGAIAILLLFALMLVRAKMGQPTPHVTGSWWLGFILASALFVILAAAAFGIDRPAPPAADVPDVAALGTDLLRQWVMPFEAASLLLTAAMIGAIAVAIELRRQSRRSAP